MTTKSGEYDSVVKALVSAGVLVFVRNGKKHILYRIAEPFMAAASDSMVIHSHNGSINLLHTGRNYLSVLRKKLKPGTIEGVMGWSYQGSKLLTRGIASAVQTSSKGITIGEQLAAKDLPSMEFVSEPVVGNKVLNVEVKEVVMANIPVVEDKSDNNLPRNDFNIPEKVILDPTNKALGEIINGYIDRQYLLQKLIQDREKAIEALQTQLNEAREEFKQNSEFIEQLELAIIALPKNPITIMPDSEVKLREKEDVQTTSTFGNRGVNTEQLASSMVEMFKSNQSRAFSKEQIASYLAMQYPEKRVDGLKARVTYILSRPRKNSNWKRFDRGMYIYKG
jgi:hypothetical protein